MADMDIVDKVDKVDMHMIYGYGKPIEKMGLSEKVGPSKTVSLREHLTEKNV